MAKDIHPTPHLIDSMQARNVTWGEIVEIVNNPEVVYGPDPEGRSIMQKGRLSVVVSYDGAVITVLLRQNKKWNNDQAGNRDGQQDQTYTRTGSSPHLRGRREPRKKSYYKKARGRGGK